MKKAKCKVFFHTIISFSLMVLYSCHEERNEVKDEKITQEVEEEEKNYMLPNIDLSNWKVTLPIGNPTEVKPPEILDYAKNEMLKKFMYNDSTDGSLVFYTYPEASTRNSSYSRTELREQMIPGRNDRNWTFEEGGLMSGILSVPEVSIKEDGKTDRLMVMQIHGRLTNEQRDQIGEDDNNAPPILKVYWADGKIHVKTKELKNPDASGTEILYTDSWKDGESHVFEEEVANEKFSMSITASAGKIAVALNEETVVFENGHLEKWGVFENYFKAGNYLMSTDEGAFSKVKFYELEVLH